MYFIFKAIGEGESGDGLEDDGGGVPGGIGVVDCECILGAVEGGNCVGDWMRIGVLLKIC